MSEAGGRARPPHPLHVRAKRRDAAPALLAPLGEDDPVPAWYGDGSAMAVFATGGLYRLDSATGHSERIGEGAFGGQVDISPR